MDRLRKLWKREQEYEPLANGSAEGDGPDSSPSSISNSKPPTFSYTDYAIFLLLGVSMLWAWNMFLAAGPYFQHRFRGNAWISDNFQAAEVSVSTVTNLGSMLILTRMQANASYPKRIVASLMINMATFALLALSTSGVGEVGAEGYFGFLMVMMFLTSLATGLGQNGIFAMVAGFGQPTYTQGIMTGQAVAGVLPCIAQIVSVLSVQGGPRPPKDHPPPPSHSPGAPPGPPPVRSTSALIYFLTATAIAVATLLAFLFLLARHRKPLRTHSSSTPDPPSEPDHDPPARKPIPMLHLARKLRWLASGVFLTFAVTMLFPIFTQRIVSVRPAAQQPPLLQPPCFIPLAFLFWNAGDLLGRLITAVPSLSLTSRPRTVFALALARIVWVGGYQLCNIRGQGAAVASDFFYLVVVQLGFGLSNGYLGSTCMIGAGEWVEEEEREAAGGFMGLCLVGGLAVGSLVSFVFAGV